LPTASGRNLEVSEDTANTPPSKQEDTPPPPSSSSEEVQNTTPISERRKALFEPLEPIKNVNGRRPSAESLLPPPDFESANYPKGWLIGKKRKLVNVDVVESMRRIAIQEMNRKVPSFLSSLYFQAKTKIFSYRPQTQATCSLTFAIFVVVVAGQGN